MHDDRDLVEERISRELSERIVPLVHPERRALDVEAGASLDDVAPFEVGGRWGAPWTTTWFRFSGEVPGEWGGRRVDALLDLGFRMDAPGFQCEGLVRDEKGRPVQGIHPRRQAVRMAGAPGPVVLVVEAAANPAFPQFRPSELGSPDTAGTRQLYRLERAELVVVDLVAEALLYDLDVLDGVMRTLPLDDPRRARVRHLARGGARRGGAPRGTSWPLAVWSPRRSPRRPVRTRTVSSQPVTPTSTRRGCGRRRRRSASAPARSPPPCR